MATDRWLLDRIFPFIAFWRARGPALPALATTFFVALGPITARADFNSSWSAPGPPVVCGAFGGVVRIDWTDTPYIARLYRLQPREYPVIAAIGALTYSYATLNQDQQSASRLLVQHLVRLEASGAEKAAIWDAFMPFLDARAKEWAGGFGSFNLPSPRDEIVRAGKKQYILVFKPDGAMWRGYVGRGNAELESQHRRLLLPESEPSLVPAE